MTSSRTLARLSRILALIPYVLARGSVPVEEVLRRFGYTKDQLTKDLNTVFVCGLPGYGPGDLMEAYIDEDEVVIDAADYFARAPRLTSTEALSLLAAGLTLIAAGQATETLQSAVRKLTKVVLGEGEVISVDVPADPANVAALRDSARERKVVRITYRSLSREEETVRDVEPWAVFTTMGNWYLQGHCRLVGAERVFRVDRIRHLEVGEERFERPADVPEPGVGYTPSDNDVSALIDLAPAARWVLDYYPVEVVSEEDDRTRIRFSSPDAELPARLLLRLGESAHLVSGPEVAQRLGAVGGSLLARYA